MILNSEELNKLRNQVSKRVSEKRFSHILGVENMAKTLGEALLPDYVDELRAAALLHDISKELSYDDQIRLLKENDFHLTDEDMSTKGVLHSFTAPIIVKRDFFDFASDNVMSAVLNHTVGSPNMSVFDKIIFISDYCEETRRYDSCVKVRNFLLEGLYDLSVCDRLKRLDEACLMSINGAIEALTQSEAFINSRMLLTKKSLLLN